MNNFMSESTQKSLFMPQEEKPRNSANIIEKCVIWIVYIFINLVKEMCEYYTFILFLLLVDI